MPKANLNQTITIDLTESVKSQGPAEEWIEELQFIPLETKPECFISLTHRSDLNKNHIVIASNETVHLFNREGKHLNSFKRNGKGPGEYGSIYVVALVPDREEIMVGDHNQRKILCYDFAGNLTCEIQPPFMPTKVAPLNGGLFACYTGRLAGIWDIGQELFQVVLLDRTGRFVSKHLPFRYPMQSTSGGLVSHSGEEGSCLINPGYGFDIYQAGPGNQFSRKYRFSFGNYDLDTNLLNDENIASNKNPSRLFAEKLTFLQSLAVTTNTISFWAPVIQKNMRFGTRQINRKSGNIRFMEVDTANIFGKYAGIPIEFNEKSSGDFFIFSIDAIDMMEIIKKLTSDQKNILSKCTGYDQLAQLKEDDNPVMVLYRVRDF